MKVVEIACHNPNASVNRRRSGSSDTHADGVTGVRVSRNADHLR